MNTPAHVVVSLLCLGRQDRAAVITPLVIGAILPDAPMFVMYFIERVVRGTPESVIWREVYHAPHWQNFIDLFNSLPLMVLGLGLSVVMNSQFGWLLFASMILHVAGDLPLHHHDAHRHFFPLSDWRFKSPLSYWDPNHYGHIVSLVEIIGAIAGCVLLLQIYQSWPSRLCIGLIGLAYGVYFAYALVVWR